MTYDSTLIEGRYEYYDGAVFDTHVGDNWYDDGMIGLVGKVRGNDGVYVAEPWGLSPAVGRKEFPAHQECIDWLIDEYESKTT